MKADKISVIIPIYKVEKYLNQCVSSIVNQTYKNLEIILVNDGSPDKCPFLCDVWAQMDSRIRVIHKSNGGLSSARNAGLNVASGDYIGFIDSDDYINEFMYEKLLSGFTNKNIGIVSCGVLYDREGCVSTYLKNWLVSSTRIISYKDFPHLLLSGKVNYTVVSKLYKKELLHNVRFREGKVNEDTLFMFDLSFVLEDKNLNMVEIPYDGYYYRHIQGSISRNKNRPLVIDSIQNYEVMSKEAYMKDNPQLGHLLLQCRNKMLYYFIHQTMANKDLNLYFEEHYQKFIQEPLKNFRSAIKLGFVDTVKLFVLRYLPCLYKIRYGIK